MQMRHLHQRIGSNWMLWGVHLSIYLIALGVIISDDGVDRSVLIIVLLGWMGLLILHFLYLGMNAQSQKRKHDDLEKPKLAETQFSLGDDGELVPLNDETKEHEMSRKMSGHDMSCPG